MLVLARSRRLRHLDLRRTQVRDLSPLITLDALERVLVDGLDLDPAALASLRQRRPGLDIVGAPGPEPEPAPAIP
ncbi:MAG: hypothetical protein KC420_13190 [Myxococcales bacterium]|nr:hypothetical protein [Myxococcales bacterium]MCB9706872.1 hypothetical protein [Myxococcales bacterium]